MIRYCWNAPLSPRDIAEGLGMTGHNAVSRLSAACKGVMKIGLMTPYDDGRYKVNHDAVNRLKVLSELRRQP